MSRREDPEQLRKVGFSDYKFEALGVPERFQMVRLQGLKGCSKRLSFTKKFIQNCKAMAVRGSDEFGDVRF